MGRRRAVIIGAGPAGLTAALELLERTDIRPIVLEQGDWLGGISRTVTHHGNRIDIGGHRFFSRADRVMDWWLRMMPVQRLDSTRPQHIAYQSRTRSLVVDGSGPDPEAVDEVLLLRPRKSRIFHQGQFFDYPITLSPDTVRKLGLGRTSRIGASYLRASLRPRPENTLEDFMINRFGRELYLTFFKDYTEKVWGTPCNQISAEWGAQRIKGLNLRAAAEHFFRRLLPQHGPDIAQRGTETSLIEQFLYPKLGPGQMWEVVADQVRSRGGEVRTGWEVVGLQAARTSARRLGGVRARRADGQEQVFAADHVFSTMPLRNLVRALEPTFAVPEPVRAVSEGLVYRDFIAVALLLKRLRATEPGPDGRPRPITDNWIYLQEPGIEAGRLQIYSNWSPYMVARPDTVMVGLEYFCNRGDRLWRQDDSALLALGARELEAIGVARPDDVLDGTVVRVPKTYPAYFGTYDRFDTLRSYLGGIENLWPIGRNGMHRYNNQDHSMLSAMVSVDDIVDGRVDHRRPWDVNTEQEYHEQR